MEFIKVGKNWLIKNSNGRIISEIFNVSNQVNALGGIYTGFEIAEQ